MNRRFEVYSPQEEQGGPPVQLARPERPGPSLVLSVAIGVMAGVIFSEMLLGGLAGLAWWLFRRRTR